MNDSPQIPWKYMLVILSLGLLLFLFPPFLQNGIILGHDTFLHTIYIHKFIDAFLEGQFPVRVIDWIFPGANIPLFNFYQPGFYYLILLLKLTGFSYSGALNFGLFFLWIISGVGMFLFVRKHFGFLPGLTSGLLFVFAPYHIVDIFVRAAFPEFTALACFPWICWFLAKYYDTKKEVFGFFLSLTVALAALSHPPTFVMFFPWIGIYLLFLAKKNSIRTLIKPFISLVVGLLLISFFIIPVFTEQQYVHMELTYKDPLFDFHNHFVCISQLFKPTWGYGLSVKGCNDNVSFQLGIIHWIMVLCTLILIPIQFLQQKDRIQKNNALLAGAALVLLFFTLCMMLPVSLPIWEHVLYLRFIEFPWRFLALAIFLASFLGGYSISVLQGTKAYVVYAIVVYGIFYLYIPYLHANTADATDFNTNHYLALDTEYMHSKYSPQQTFFPQTTRKLLEPQKIPQVEAAILSGKGSISQTLSTAAEKKYEISVPDRTTVRFFIHYFPGWTMYVDNNAFPISYSNIYGYIDANIPRGTHAVHVVFERTPSRTLGDTLSFLTILFLPFLFIPHVRKFFQKKSER